jgi:hypothetical protein
MTTTGTMAGAAPPRMEALDLAELQAVEGGLCDLVTFALGFAIGYAIGKLIF